MKKNKVNVIGFANRKAVEFGEYLTNFGVVTIAGGALLCAIGRAVVANNIKCYGAENEKGEETIRKIYEAISSKAN